MSEPISGGSVSVEVVPDARGFDEKLQAQLRDVTVKIKAKVDKAFDEEIDKKRQEQDRDPVKVPVKAANLDAFAAKIKADAAAIGKSTSLQLPLTTDGEILRRQVAAQVALIEKLVKVEVPVGLGDAAVLRAKMAEELEVLKRMAAAADPTVEVKADTGGAEAKIAAVGAQSQGAAGGLSAMVTAAALLAPALIPVTAAVGGLVVALSAPLLAAGGGLAIFGIIASKVISQSNQQQAAVNAAAKRVAAAKAALAASDASAARAQAASNAAAQRAAGTRINAATLAASGAFTPGKNAAFNSQVTAAQGALGNAQANAAASAANKHAAAQAKLTAALAAYNAALGKLSPEQQKFESALSSLKGAFTKLIDQAGPVVLGPVIKGMNLLSDILPKLQPLLATVGGAIDGVLGSIGKAVKGGGFDTFIKGFAALAGPSIRVLASIFGNLAVGFGGMLKTFAPLGLAILGVLDSITSRFAKFGSGGGFKTFLDYVKKVGPPVAEFFKQLGVLFGHLVAALAPGGLLVLKALTGIGKALNSLPPAVLPALIAGIAGVIAIAGGPLTAVAIAVAGVIALFATWYDNSAKLREILAEVGQWITGSLWPAIKQLGQAIGSNLKPVLDALVKAFRDDLLPTLKKIWPDLQVIATNVGEVVGAFLVLESFIYGKVLPILIEFVGFLIKNLIPPLVWVAKVITDTLVGAFRLFLKAIATVLDGIGHLLVAMGSIPFNPLGGAMKSAGKAMEDAATHARNLADAINGIPTDVGIKVNLALPSNQRLAALANSSHASSVHGQIAGARALGGPVTAGRLYQVNERGIELFRPAVNGTIEPHVPLGSGGRAGAVTVEIGTVQAHDYSDFMGQMQQRAQRVAIGGRPT